MTNPIDGLEAVSVQIAAAARDSGRSLEDIKLTIASKTQPAEQIRLLLNAGHRIFGENRVQEAESKWPKLKTEFPGIELHMIGPLQSNKAEDAVRLFDVIETIDRLSLVKALSKAMKKLDKRPRLLLEVNIGSEPQKAGIAPADVDSFISMCRSDYNLEIEGLMCIPPHDLPSAPFFREMASISRRNNIHVLSMGMSADFTQAIDHGATYVRVGTAIFGSR